MIFFPSGPLRVLPGEMCKRDISVRTDKKDGNAMIYIRKLRSLFLFAGLEKEEYVSLIPVIREKNRELLRVFSLLGAVFFFLLSIASLLSGGFASANSITYLQCGI